MRRKKHKYLKFCLVLVALFLVWFLFISRYNVIKLIKNELIIKRKQEQISTVKEEIGHLSVEKQKLQEGDKKLLEKKARELGMAKPGETIIRISDEEINQKKE